MGFNRTGDGIASALLTLEALAGGDLAERGAMAKLPQRLVNVRVRDREALHNADDVKQAIGASTITRTSDEEAQQVCDRLVALVQAELG